VDTVVYYGDDKKISMVTQSGLANEARDGINLTGIDVFGRTASSGTQYGQATTDVFNALIRIKEELEKTAAVTKTNSLGGTLDVDGGYTGPADYQDFAVKIDALKVRLNNYAQTNTTGGSLALSWTGAKTAMPVYASPNSLRMRIDALKVSANVAAPVGHVTGALTLESTTNPLPALPVGGLQFRVDAVQVETGAVRQSNAIGGALNVTYNGYGTGNAATIPANIKVRADAVDAAGTVTAASYSLDDGAIWITATGAAGAFTLNDPAHTVPPPLDANDTGLAITIAADMENAATNTYTIPLTSTGKALQASYSSDNGATWTAAAPGNTANPFQFTLGGAYSGISMQLGTVATNQLGDVHAVTAMTTDGTVAQASYSTDGGATWAAAKVDTASPAGSFILGDSGFIASIAKNSTNNGTNVYTLSDLSIDAATETAALSYSLDKGNTWTKATAPVVTQSTPDSGALSLGGDYTGLPAFQDLVVTVQAWKVSTTSVNQTNTAGGAMKIAYNDTLVTPMPAVNPVVRIDTVDSSGRVTALSSSIDGGATWQSATAQLSQGPTVFSLDAATYAGFSVTIAANAANAANDTYTAVGSAMVAGDPALVSYTTEPAPDVSGTITASTSPVWSMKGANPAVQDFALPDGVTANIAANTATVLGTSTYSFRIPPRFALAYGVEVSVDPNANNAVKDAHTFHMARDTEHTEASDAMGPDLDWLSDKGLVDLDAVHDQILSAVVDVGTKSSMYEMTGNMLESSNINLTSVLATNEDIDMAKAIIDMKTAENTYKAALSFGARIMPTSLVDFLR
jgi:flagellin-like hook-associated protein FlgL